MAIQNRRGSYTDFNGGSNLADGEFGIVMSGDTNTSDGTGTYISNGGGIVHRLATEDDLSAVEAKIANLNSGYGGDMSPAAISVPSGTWTSLYPVTFSPGLYLVVSGAAFDVNGTGVRSIDFGSTSMTSHGRTAPMVQASSNQTRMQAIRILNLSGTVSYTLWGYQNSGSAVDCYPWVAYIRLSDNV